jgi:hypothetical protein
MDVGDRRHYQEKENEAEEKLRVLQPQGETFEFYLDVGFPVGYDADSKNFTSWIRFDSFPGATAHIYPEDPFAAKKRKKDSITRDILVTREKFERIIPALEGGVVSLDRQAVSGA